MSQPSTPSPFRFSRSTNDGFSNRKPAKARPPGSGLRNVTTPADASRKTVRRNEPSAGGGQFKTIIRKSNVPDNWDEHARSVETSEPKKQAEARNRKVPNPDGPLVQGHTGSGSESEQQVDVDHGVNDDDEDMLLNAADEQDTLSQLQLADSYEEQIPKRRRLDKLPDPREQHPQHHQTPQRPLSALRLSNHRPPDYSSDPSFNPSRRFAPVATANYSPFSFSTSQSPASTAAPLRPRFIASAQPSHTAAGTPLPDAFSPHRNKRGQERYVPGGWASQVRGWVFDVAANAEGKGKEDAVVEVEEVEMVKGVGGQGAMAVVRGRDLGANEEIRAERLEVLLVGEGASDGSGMSDTHGLDDASSRVSAMVEKGMKIGLGPPSWTMDLPDTDGRPGPRAPANPGETSARARIKTWTVCAGWKILR